MECWILDMSVNKPYTGSFSCYYLRVNTENPRIIPIFSSCGEYACLCLRLQKYGRIACLLKATNGLLIALGFTTYFSPFGPEKAARTRI